MKAKGLILSLYRINLVTRPFNLRYLVMNKTKMLRYANSLLRTKFD